MYEKYGTWTTIDCPTKQVGLARTWLQSEFGFINGYVWQKNNAHDLAPNGYPSFEVNYPLGMEETIDDDCDCLEEDCEDCNAIKEKDNWHIKANEIEEKYHKKFEKYL